MARDLSQMTTGEVRHQAERKGIRNVDQMNKGQMIQALGGTADAHHGGGQRQKDPHPKGAKPKDFKNIPGNQT